MPAIPTSAKVNSTRRASSARLVAAAPWLSRPWRQASWATLLLIGAARLVTGGLLPMQLVLALAVGVAVGAGRCALRRARGRFRR
jgi:hypothetical protein